MEVLAIVLFLSRIFSALPLNWSLRIGRFFSWLWYWGIPIRLKVARQNISRVFKGSLDAKAQKRILRATTRHWAMYGVESLRLPYLSDKQIEQLIKREGFEHLEAGLARGKGIVCVTAHIGSFDLLACSGPLMGLPLAVVFKDIAWKPARDFWYAVRDRTGVRQIAPRNSKNEIRASLARNEIVAFAVDQHMARHRAIVCDFFNHLAATSPAPVRFAMETGATIITCHIERLDQNGHHLFHVDPPFILETPYKENADNIRYNTERLNRVIEGWIRKVPEQWLWLHRRWKVDDNPDGWEIPHDLWTKVGRKGDPPLLLNSTSQIP
ncbi:MAG: lysophospholipid acyltransferase family protein [Deltaproteobacteria bacterium]|nr:lysophospholipid acyltransferase family protein [Deltaproteobacteria bacterium]